MTTHRLAASFWRGGTSRGLIVRAKDIGGFSPEVRERMLLQAMGSPDPDGRQIDGLGGGVSSLSKICIIGAPKEAAAEQQRFGKLPGVDWADERDGYDVVYRFGQVGIRTAEISYGATCGNMLSAVASAAISDGILAYSKLFTLARSLSPIEDDAPVPIPLKILSANSGEILHAKVLVDRLTLQLYDAPAGQGVSIAGVPGLAAPVELEFPFAGGLPSGSSRDTIEVDGRRLSYTLADAGLPNVFVEPHEVGLSTELLSKSAADLDAMRDVHETLERIRVAVAQAHSIECTPPSPKISLVGAGDADADVVVRTISTGNFHRTVPGTTLSALALASTADGSVIADLFSRARDGSIRARHPAGVAEAKVRSDETGRAICLTRTARKIMDGHVMVEL